MGTAGIPLIMTAQITTALAAAALRRPPLRRRKIRRFLRAGQSPYKLAPVELEGQSGQKKEAHGRITGASLTAQSNFPVPQGSPPSRQECRYPHCKTIYPNSQ